LCVCVCVCVCVCTPVCACVCVFLFVHIHMHVHVFIHVFVRIFTWTSERVYRRHGHCYVWGWEWSNCIIDICMYIYIWYVHVHTCIYTCVPESESQYRDTFMWHMGIVTRGGRGQFKFHMNTFMYLHSYITTILMWICVSTYMYLDMKAKTGRSLQEMSPWRRLTLHI